MKALGKAYSKSGRNEERGMRKYRPDLIYLMALAFFGLAILVKGVAVFGGKEMEHYLKREITESILSSCLKGATRTVYGEQAGNGQDIVMNEIRGNFPVFQFLEKEGQLQVESKDILEEIRLLEGMDEDKQEPTQEDGVTEEMKENEGKAEKEETEERGEKIPEEKLKDFDYLVSRFYSIDKTTTIGSDQLDAVKMASVDLVMPPNPDVPQILIYHTHSQEGYSDTKEGDESKTVVALGEKLAEKMREYGYGVLHDTTSFDKENRNYAYSNAEPAIQKILNENETIEVVIDIHRDGVNENTRLVTEIDGKGTAQFMFFNGLSRTTANGDIEYLKNPYINENLAFSFRMQLAATELYPGLARKIYLKGYRYNMHFRPKSLLIEIGAQTNTFEEAENAIEPLSVILNKVLSGE